MSQTVEALKSALAKAQAAAGSLADMQTAPKRVRELEAELAAAEKTEGAEARAHQKDDDERCARVLAHGADLDDAVLALADKARALWASLDDFYAYTKRVDVPARTPVSTMLSMVLKFYVPGGMSGEAPRIVKYLPQRRLDASK